MMLGVKCFDCENEVKIRFDQNASLVCQKCGSAKVIFDQDVMVSEVIEKRENKYSFIPAEEQFNIRRGLHNPVYTVRKAAKDFEKGEREARKSSGKKKTSRKRIEPVDEEEKGGE